MIDHILALGAHEAVHRAVHAYSQARAAKSAKAYLLATYELLERIRVGQLFKQPEAMQKTASAVAQVLHEARSHREDYRALQDKQPEHFRTLQDLLADYDYRLRGADPKDATVHSLQFHSLTLKLKHCVEAFGVDIPKIVHQVSLKDCVRMIDQAGEEPGLAAPRG